MIEGAETRLGVEFRSVSGYLIAALLEHDIAGRDRAFLIAEPLELVGVDFRVGLSAALQELDLALAQVVLIVDNFSLAREIPGLPGLLRGSGRCRSHQ